MDQLDANIIALLFASALLVAAVMSSAVATRFGAPLLFLFLVIGMLVGEDGPGGLIFDSFATANLVGSAALALILFDGGLRTKAASFRGVFAPAFMLATVGVLVTAVTVAFAVMLMLKFRFLEALLLGATIASTDAAAMFFLVKSGGLRLQHRVGDTLEIESGTNDPFAVFLVFALVTVLKPGAQATPVAALFFEQLAIGASMGVLGGLFISTTLRRVTLPSGLHPVFVAAGALLLFAQTAWLGGSGFLAAYLAGLIVGNRPMPAGSSIIAFTDAATWFAQIVMFVLLGLLAVPHRLPAILGPSLVIAGVLMFVARPLAVAACLGPFRFRFPEQAFVAWVGLRGAVAIFLATVPVLVGLPNGLVYFDVVFFVVLISLLVQGWTVAPAANVFGVALPGLDHPESRTELDLPDQTNQELIGYPIRPESDFLRHPLLPSWAKLVLVARRGETLLPGEAGELAVGDYAYLLAPPERAKLLDRLFAETEGERVRSEIYFGEFIVPAATSMGEIVALYAPGAKSPAATVAEAFALEFGTPSPGDVVQIGDIELVAKTVDNDRLTEVGLRLEPERVKDRVRRYARRWSKIKTA